MLFLSVLFLFSFRQFALAAPPDGSRIVGGEPADITDVPYQLALETGPIIWTQMCGATIISQRSALTAGHCAGGFTAKQIRLRAGSTRVQGGTIHHAETVIVHEKFSFDPINYDITIIFVTEPFEFGTNVQPANLALEPPQPGEIALVSGWGVTHEGGILPSQVLRKVEIPIVNTTTCAADYAGFDQEVTETMICAGEPGEDSCQGDSGGPLAINGTIVGVVSWGKGCAEQGYPGVYTNVAYFAEWLEQNNATGTLE